MKQERDLNNAQEIEGNASKHKGFDDRIIRYELVHKIEDKDFESLISAIDPQPNQTILDGCSGYGEVAKRIIDTTAHHSFRPEVYLFDESSVQLERAKHNLPDLDADHIAQGDIRHTGFTDNTFDTAVIKMGIHELPKDEQIKVLQEMFRIIKPNGKFVTWELALDKDNQVIFQDIIRKKDELAGFNQLVTNRYFPRLDELHSLLEQAGFENVEDFHTIWYQPSTWDRREELVSKEHKELLEQKGVLSEEDIENLRQLGEQRATALADYVRQRIPEELREKMKYKDTGNNVQFEVRKMILKATKPAK